MNDSSVVVYRDLDPSYPRESPFHPDQYYPEYIFGEATQEDTNNVYNAVRESLRLSGSDIANFGTPQWNPLGAYVRPGQTVLLKPNWVREGHPRDYRGGEYTVTHGSVIRAVADFVWKALERSGRVIVADGPQTDQSFERIACQVGMSEIQEFYHSQGLNLELVDFRGEEWTNVDEVIVDRKTLPGDPAGNVLFDLGQDSEFEGHRGMGRYYGADYDASAVNSHHRPSKHEYLIAGSAIGCDVFINIPKLKTHKKAGITVSLKNLVGVNADKNYLPHHTTGAPSNGGDQFPSLTYKTRLEHTAASWLRSAALKSPMIGTWVLRRGRRFGKSAFGNTDNVIRSGNWYGNDTVWRMCLDLNKLVLYGARDGSLSKAGEDRKVYLSFVDGFIAGEGNGPMDPDPVQAGLILFGTNPAHVDATAAVLIGFDPDKLPIIRQAYDLERYPIAGGHWTDVHCLSNDSMLCGALGDVRPERSVPRFRPHFGWKGHLEADAAGT